MGEVVELRVLARVDKVEIRSNHDGDGHVVSTKRIHLLNALSVEQVGDLEGGRPRLRGDCAWEVEARGQARVMALVRDVRE
jgi:hypothetical protein